MLFAISIWVGRDFTTLQLYILGVACILMALPHYAKIKLAGFELERARITTAHEIGRNQHGLKQSEVVVISGDR